MLISSFVGTTTGFETCGVEYNNGGAYDALDASCQIQETRCEARKKNTLTECTDQVSRLRSSSLCKSTEACGSSMLVNSRLFRAVDRR